MGGEDKPHINTMPLRLIKTFLVTGQDRRCITLSLGHVFGTAGLTGLVAYSTRDHTMSSRQTKKRFVEQV